MDSPLTPLQERGIVTTGKRGLSMLGHCRNTVITISPRQQTVPVRQGRRGAKRRRGWIRKHPPFPPLIPRSPLFLCHADSAKDWIIREPCPITLPLDYRWLRAMISQSFAQSVVVQLATNFVNPAKRHPLGKLCPLAQSAWQ